MRSKDKGKQMRPLILVAEDVPKNMEVVCNILRKEGYRLAMAGNGKQALDMVPNVQPDLILLDVMMPEMDGFEVCRHLKDDPDTRDIPIIFLTAKADTADVVQGFEIGAVDYVTKPFKGTELLSRVKSHLELKFARESLKHLNATKDTFFSIIAHDLKDPLQFLLLSAESLYKSYDAYDEEKRRDYIHRFYKNSRQISGLLENLLEWARSQRDRLEVNPEKIDLFAIAAESVELLKESALKKEITLSSQVEPGIYAYADANMTRTILRNLVSNAVKFTHPGGEVKITASLTSRGDGVQVTVTDNGVGIEKMDLEDLFNIEVKRTTRGTAKEKGSGLGLILCKEFVDKNNGTLEVSSEPGKGSGFTVILPIQ